MSKQFKYFSILILLLAFIVTSCEPRNIVEVEQPHVIPAGERLFSQDWSEGENLDGNVITALSQSFNSYTIAATSGGNFLRQKNEAYDWMLTQTGANPILVLYRSNNGFIYGSTQSGELYGSNTNGRTWDLLKNFNNGINTIVAAKDNKIILGTSSGLYISTDNTENWNRVNDSILSHISIYSLISLEDENILAGTVNGIYSSFDNGISWVKTNFNETCYIFSLSYNSDLFAGTSNGVYRSDDMGKSWLHSGFSGEKIISLAVTNQTHVFAGTISKGIYYSNNNGYSWNNFGFENRRINSILDLPHLDIIMAAVGDKIYRLRTNK